MGIRSEVRRYLAESARARAVSGLDVSGATLVRDFFPWRRSLRRSASPLGDGRPWMTFGAIAFLRRRLRPTMRALEFGSGGSTIFVGRRVEHITTIEHDPGWAEQVVRAAAAAGLSNVRVQVVEPEAGCRGGDPAEPRSYVSSAAPYAGSSFARYAAAAEAFGDSSVDLVILDGRARPSCGLHAIPKVRPGGLVVLDNAERSHYRWIHDALDGPAWEKRVFSGPAPYHPEFWQTCVWTKAA